MYLYMCLTVNICEQQTSEILKIKLAENVSCRTENTTYKKTF
jgi:hypothetical protein